MINNLILNMFIELNSKPITAAEKNKKKNRFSMTDRSHQNQRTHATKTFKSPFKAVKVIRKGRERQTVSETKCKLFNDLKLLLQQNLANCGRVIHRESEGLHGKCASLQTS